MTTPGPTHTHESETPMISDFAFWSDRATDEIVQAINATDQAQADRHELQATLHVCRALAAIADVERRALSEASESEPSAAPVDEPIASRWPVFIGNPMAGVPAGFAMPPRLTGT